MSRKSSSEPKSANSRLTNACTSLQVSGQLVRFYPTALLPKTSRDSDDDQSGGYSSPVCYAHLREFREGF
ncbi:hypothetical protein [Pontibacter lucknowensis]|uniref:Uncharacterized protein n=1 Tax=Pontibacter lucknowensis TaxID=1077936 RepID=A0A1N6W1G9_9BACT|nr:hypothetical protein [Pontibacter lucknowensis]SIQ83756.1 hypothetical protein SAMN05421545_1303 [Pontibacter lucknowensis]